MVAIWSSNNATTASRQVTSAIRTLPRGREPGGRSVQGGDSRALGRPWTCFIREASTAGGRADDGRWASVTDYSCRSVARSPPRLAFPLSHVHVRDTGLARRADLTLPLSDGQRRTMQVGGTRTCIRNYRQQKGASLELDDCGPDVYRCCADMGNAKALSTAGVGRKLMEMIRRRQMEFFRHVLMNDGLKKMVITGKIERKSSKRATKKKILRQIWCMLVEQHHSR